MKSRTVPPQQFDLMSIKTFGFEQEFFVKDIDKSYCIATSLPHDDCGYLAEARGQQHEDPRSARHLLRTAVEKLHTQAIEKRLSLHLHALVNDMPKEFRRVMLRRFGKNPSQAFFAHGGSYRNTNPRAGLHIHFGTERRIEGFIKDGSEYRSHTWTVVEPLNVPRIIWMLDDAFRKEIKAAKRVLGEYEPKDWGFEYRSLPADIDLDKVVVVLEKIKAENL